MVRPIRLGDNGQAVNGPRLEIVSHSNSDSTIKESISVTLKGGEPEKNVKFITFAIMGRVSQSILL